MDYKVFLARDANRYSYKGTKPINMRRLSRKRGKQVKKRGIFKAQVCVATALNR